MKLSRSPSGSRRAQSEPSFAVARRVPFQTQRELFFLIQSVNEAALVKFGDEAPIDKLFHFGGFYSRLRYGDLFKHAAHSIRAGIGLGGSDARIVIVSFLGDSVVAHAEKLLDHLNAFRFVRPVKSDSLDNARKKPKTA